MAENLKAYEQACNTIRHYSTLSFNTRTLTVIQGIVLLAAWAATYNNGNSKLILQIALPVFGIIFTLLLTLFNYGYFAAARSLYELVSVMEEQLFDAGFRPLQVYCNNRQQRQKNLFTKVFILYAPFTLLIIMFSIALIISIFKL